MAATLVVLIGLLMTHLAQADEVRLPFALNIKAFKKDLKQHGLNLYDVDGFVRNEGTTVKVFSYRQLTIEELTLIKDAAFRNLRK